MSWFTKIFGGGNPVADTVVETAKGVADIVERWAPSDAKSHEMYMDVQKTMNEAVKNAREAGKTDAVGSGWFPQVLHAIQDFVNHMMAPALTVFVVGALFGFIKITTQTTDPLILTWGEAVGAYWLGARAITRDIPSLIKMLVELKRSGK